MINEEAVKQLQRGAAIEQANAAIKIPDLIALPSDFKTVDLEHQQIARRRARNQMNTTKGEDFATYVTTHKEEGASIFVDPRGMRAVAVFNIGTPEKPGHGDNTASLLCEKTAGYEALLDIADGLPKSQQDIAEFLEDWAHLIACSDSDRGNIPVAQAVAAIRKLTIEAMQKLESEQNHLSASRSTFDQVKATSTQPIPTFIAFKVVPYLGLNERQFEMRLGVFTRENPPRLNLRIIKREGHEQEMADEFTARVRDLVKDVPVLIGVFTPQK